MSEIKTNKISSLDSSNSDITIDPDGTGDTIVASGNLGIGTTSPSTSHRLTLDKSSNYGGIQLKQSGTQVGQIIQEGGTGNVYIDADSAGTGGSLILRTNGGTEISRVTSNGLTFNGDTAAANALSDYEEGSFTPTAEDESSNTGSAGEATGYYRKIGGLVHCEIRFTNINTTGLTSSEDFTVGGLPFTHSARNGSVFAVSGDVYHASINTDFTGNIIALLGENQDFIKFVEMVDSGGDHDIQVADLTSGTADILMSIAYHTEQ